MKTKKSIKSIDLFNNIKSPFIIKKIFGYLEENIPLKLIKYSKKSQKRLNFTLQNYKEFALIEIEIIPSKKKEGNFINVIDKKNEKYFHIFINGSKKEINQKDYQIKNDYKKIKVIIRHSFSSFKNLFKNCACIESINFKRSYIKSILDMSSMFEGCSSLKNLYISNLNTNKVINMGYMFFGCSSLKEINLSNFNTNNVADMHCMFKKCSSLNRIDLSKFNFNKVTNINCIFEGCSSLKEINISNLNLQFLFELRYLFYGCSSLSKIILPNFINNHIDDMTGMFSGCYSLNYINFYNFYFNEGTKMKSMFYNCPFDIIEKIKNENKNIYDNAFI